MEDKGVFVHGVWVNGELWVSMQSPDQEYVAEKTSEYIEMIYSDGQVGEDDEVAYGPVSPAEMLKHNIKIM